VRNMGYEICGQGGPQAIVGISEKGGAPNSGNVLHFSGRSVSTSVRTSGVANAWTRKKRVVNNSKKIKIRSDAKKLLVPRGVGGVVCGGPGGGVVWGGGWVGVTSICILFLPVTE